jgi:hypothetical protein
MLAGIDPQWLRRWNGLPGTVAVARIEGPALAKAEKILWAREPGTTVAAEFPTADGNGTILFSQLGVQAHLDPAKPDYDPVAETILFNMLSR